MIVILNTEVLCHFFFVKKKLTCSNLATSEYFMSTVYVYFFHVYLCYAVFRAHVN